ncbi:VOC family protein [Paenibacillus sp. S28]|uniref:VOC family protein n=1 Tax=Paenibacillus sp. S28 TaxID=2767463 RepID=UPI001909A27D|nr:VOC family protein [Paenibacillus sp. S28]MBJ9987468.1 VOC family protein [Paenibacillus sp. S28]
MGVLKPFIYSEDARGQADFYIRSLGGNLESVITHGESMGVQNDLQDKVIHMCLSVAGGNYIFMSDSMESNLQGNNMSLNIDYPSSEEARGAFSKLADGGHVIYPFEQQPFGLYLGELTDRFGVRWMITAPSVSTQS